MTYYIGGDTEMSSATSPIDTAESIKQPFLPEDISPIAAAAFLLKRAGVKFTYYTLACLTTEELARAAKTYQRLVSLQMGSTFGDHIPNQELEQ